MRDAHQAYEEEDRRVKLSLHQQQAEKSGCRPEDIFWAPDLYESQAIQELAQEAQDKHDLANYRRLVAEGKIIAPKDGSPARRSDQGFVYIIRPSNGGYIKIGWTSSMKRRMRQYAPDTTILAVMPGTRKDEHRLHKKFAHLRTHGREWYPLAPQIIEEARYMVTKHGEPPTLDFSARETKTPFMGNRMNKRTGPTPREWSGVA